MPHHINKNRSEVDEAVAVEEDDVLEMRRRLGKEEGLFLGYTAAGNLKFPLNLNFNIN